jgi:hypothetical protein
MPRWMTPGRAVPTGGQTVAPFKSAGSVLVSVSCDLLSYSKGPAQGSDTRIRTTVERSHAKLYLPCTRLLSRISHPASRNASPNEARTPIRVKSRRPDSNWGPLHYE